MVKTLKNTPKALKKITLWLLIVMLLLSFPMRQSAYAQEELTTEGMSLLAAILIAGGISFTRDRDMLNCVEPFAETLLPMDIRELNAAAINAVGGKETARGDIVNATRISNALLADIWRQAQEFYTPYLCEDRTSIRMGERFQRFPRLPIVGRYQGINIFCLDQQVIDAGSEPGKILIIPTVNPQLGIEYSIHIIQNSSHEATFSGWDFEARRQIDEIWPGGTVRIYRNGVYWQAGMSSWTTNRMIAPLGFIIIRYTEYWTWDNNVVMQFVYAQEIIHPHTGEARQIIFTPIQNEIGWPWPIGDYEPLVDYIGHLAAANMITSIDAKRRLIAEMVGADTFLQMEYVYIKVATRDKFQLLRADVYDVVIADIETESPGEGFFRGVLDGMGRIIGGIGNVLGAIVELPVRIGAVIGDLLFGEVEVPYAPIGMDFDFSINLMDYFPFSIPRDIVDIIIVLIGVETPEILGTTSHERALLSHFRETGYLSPEGLEIIEPLFSLVPHSPRFEVNIPLPDFSGGQIDNENSSIAYTWVFAMEDYPTFVAIIRWSVFLIFVFGLIKATATVLTW